MQTYVIKNNTDPVLVSQALEFRQTIMKNTFGVTSDQDQWDADAYHIIVKDQDQIVGYYRAMLDSPIGFYVETEFDLTNLNLNREKVLEIGRAAVSTDNPSMNSPVPHLWIAINQLSSQLGTTRILGAASLKVDDCDILACRDHWQKKYNYLDKKHAVPLTPYTTVQKHKEKHPPKLIKVYEKIGAKIVSDPGWDPEFGTADVLTILKLKDIDTRWLIRLT